MITEKDYRYIADDVYKVDALKVNRPYSKGDLVGNDRFKVISNPIDNTSNGMQAMAVAPVDKNGNVDYSHVVIAYAGTNKDDRLDIQTDIQSIGFGDRQVLSDLKTKTFRKSQFQTALSFAEEIEKTFPSAKITTAGHSLGESLAIFPYIYPAKDNWGDKLEYHNLSQWRFDENGQLVDLDGKRVTNLKVTALAEATAGMYRYQKIKSYLSADGLSSKEEIYLDSLQGMALGEGMANAARAGADDVKHLQEEVVSKAQELWNQLDFSSFRYLSYDEVLSTFVSAGVTQDTIVDSVKQDFEQMNQKVEKLATEFDTLNQQIIQVIESKLATDKELAGEFRKWNSRI